MVFNEDEMIPARTLFLEINNSPVSDATKRNRVIANSVCFAVEIGRIWGWKI
jgi:hypothetical protein